MKILLGYSHYVYPIDIAAWVEAWLTRLRSQGIQVQAFPLTLNPPGPRLRWRELEARWRRGDKELLKMYEILARRLEAFDVFINWNGINLHPEFVRQLPIFTVYGCFDDPESSQDLSLPVAWAYDLCMVGNIAELEAYRSWGVKEVHHWPLGFRFDDYDPSLTKEKILNGNRDIDIAMLCERTYPMRRERLDQLAAAFPQGAYYGMGWPRGFLPEKERMPLLQRSKIGVNIHNSTGPVNSRTYVLPANGVMQICDNKSHLAPLFELNKEVVGFENISEAIELCRYYLDHDHERRQIAVAGWERAVREYNEIASFKIMLGHVDALNSSTSKAKHDIVISLHMRHQQTRLFRVFHSLIHPLKSACRRLKSRIWLKLSGLFRLFCRAS